MYFAHGLRNNDPVHDGSDVLQQEQPQRARQYTIHIP
jgi:hypothetical protein